MDRRDARDEDTWVVLELSPLGEREASQGLLEPHLEKFLDDVESFIPYVVHTYNHKQVLFNVMEGYCFVKAGLGENVYRSMAFNSPYLRQALGSASSLNTVPQSVIEDLRFKLAEMMASEVTSGLRVRITKGVCTGLVGVVVCVDDNVAQVHVSLRSLETIRHVPAYALVPVEGEG